MKCPFCANAQSKVVDSRDTSDFRIRRRRECLKCAKRFTTFEDVQLEEITVIKKDGRREPFDRNKLLAGLMRACEKRPVPRSVVEKIVEAVEQRLRKRPRTEVPTTLIGELVMERLKKADQVAYIRFASVYRSFTDIDSFEKALHALKKAARK
ncbi:MAG: transcriptional regulator NrdR [Candidatus Micrarchaeota archaeon]